MHPPRQVPKLGRGGPQQFTRDNLPPIQSPMMLGAPQQPMQQPADEPLQDLAMEIFARLAFDRISKQYPDAPLRELAKLANAAAMDYFEEVMK